MTSPPSNISMDIQEADFFDHDDILQQEIIEYFNRRLPVYSSMSDFKKRFNRNHMQASEIKIDDVDPNIVANVRVERIYKWLLCCKNEINIDAFRAITYIIRDRDDFTCNFVPRVQHDEVRSMMQYATSPTKLDPTIPEELRQIEANKEKKKLTGRDTPAPLSDAIVKTFNHLFEKSKLFVPLSKMDKLPSAPTTQVGAFVVEKGHTGTFRVIVDARWTNVNYDKSADKYALFTIEVLRQVTANLSVDRDGQKRPWYALNLDLRHYYHQLPLPARYKRDMVIVLNFASGKTLEIVPRAVIMGHIKSCIIAQSCTWALLLTNQEGPISSEKLDIDPSFLKNLTSTPRWIPLKSGGGVWIILDNILVLSPRKEVRDAWYAHIYKNACAAQVVLKAKEPEDLKNKMDYFGAEYKELLDSQVLFDMFPSTETEYGFMGIHFGHDTCRIVVPDEDREQEVPEGSDPESRVWNGTRKALASILGKVNWHRRVHEIKMTDETPSSRAIRYCYSILTPKDNDWKTRVEIKDEIYDGIAEAWHLRNQQLPSRASPVNTAISSTVMIATDASSSHMTAAYVVLGSSFDTTSFSAVKYSNTTWTIAMAELHAIRTAVKSTGCPRNGLIVLATDSMNCKCWLDRGTGNCPVTNEMLYDIQKHLASAGCRLYAVYVNTHDNVADDPSRGANVLDEKKFIATKVVLDLARKEALGVWSYAGGMMGAGGKELI